MQVEFLNLTPEAIAGAPLRADTPVAEFRLKDGRKASALARSVNPFSDVDLSVWHGPELPIALESLCRYVRQAEWDDRDRMTLNLKKRFHIRPERDRPNWRVAGFQSLNTVDQKIITHVFGVGEWNPDAARDSWADLLKTGDVDVRVLLYRLSIFGCRFDEIRKDRDPDKKNRVRLYKGLTRMKAASCWRLLAPIRERFMEEVTRAIQQAAERTTPRHVHFVLDRTRDGGRGTRRDRPRGRPDRDAIHFVDDRGMKVVAKGQRHAFLPLATAYLARASGETELGPETARRLYRRLKREITYRRGRYEISIHLPINWQNGIAR